MMRGTFTLTIRMGNAEMSEPEHVADAVAQVALRIGHGTRSGTIMDVNGNTVGKFDLPADDDSPDADL